ncbi:MAG: N-acyl homoserine lactonase family protein [Paracoccaceae bacterium]|nr:N-acyl homoserine lactonase family protein [Paracoccaceae bacterium]MDE2913965.1 N-acyl homoserine lactonase family protein [Paracoccaceae bacterium]
MGIAETRIYPINTGWLEADLGTYVFWKGPAGKKIWQPVFCHYVDTGTQKILIDTGLCDEARASRYHHKCEKRGCLQVHEHLEQVLGVHPDEIDAVVFTHLHWDHVQNMVKFRNARFVAPRAEIEMAYNPLPLYYRTYESVYLNVRPAYSECVFEAVENECEVFPGITMFHTPGHSVGHMAVSVATSVGEIVVCGDAIFNLRNLEPNAAEGWRYWVPARFVNSYEGWKSVEEIDKRSDYVLPCHDRLANERSNVFPYDGMPLRKRRQFIPGFKFYFGDMPMDTAERAAAAMNPEDVKDYLASLTPPSPNM